MWSAMARHYNFYTFIILRQLITSKFRLWYLHSRQKKYSQFMGRICSKFLGKIIRRGFSPNKILFVYKKTKN
jgi:hypothetical protein